MEQLNHLSSIKTLSILMSVSVGSSEEHDSAHNRPFKLVFVLIKCFYIT